MSGRFVAHCYLFACGSRHCSVITDMKQVPLWKCKLKDAFFCVCVFVCDCNCLSFCVESRREVIANTRSSTCEFVFEFLTWCAFQIDCFSRSLIQILTLNLKCILINVFILFPSFSNLAVEMGDVRDLSWSFKAYTIPRKERRPASEGKKVPCQFWCVFCQSRCCIFPVLKFILPKLRIQFSRLLSHSRGVFQTQNTYHEHISVHFSILS